MCFLARAFHIVQNPVYFSTGKIGINNQSCIFFYISFQTTRFQFITKACSTSVLPHNGVTDGLSRFSIPYNGSFTLVGDTNGSNFSGLNICFSHRFTSHFYLRLPYFIRIVLYPAWLRENLSKLALCYGNDISIFIKKDGARTGGSLIESQDIFLFHVLFSKSLLNIKRKIVFVRI